MLNTRLAKPIFTRARARPIVRTTSSIGPFWCANTCSTAARTFDLRPFARAMGAGMGLCDPEDARRFQDFHDARAQLRVVHKTVNLSELRKRS
jgi:hypothetical protein